MRRICRNGLVYYAMWRSSKWISRVLLVVVVMLLRRLQGCPVRRHKVQTVGVHQLRLGWRLRSMHLWLLVELVPVYVSTDDDDDDSSNVCLEHKQGAFL